VEAHRVGGDEGLQGTGVPGEFGKFEWHNYNKKIYF
jgi:hypothetical protein